MFPECRLRPAAPAGRGGSFPLDPVRPIWGGGGSSSGNGRARQHGQGPAGACFNCRK
jgi:hypothetical protein